MDTAIEIECVDIESISQHPQLQGNENLITIVKERARNMQEFLLQNSSIKAQHLATQLECDGKFYKVCLHKS